LIRGLDEALLMLLEEGIEKVCARHAEVADWVRKQITGMGLRLFSKAPSNGLTAIVLPSNITSKDVIKVMRDEYQVVMADGQGELQGKIIRFAHMGAACTKKDAQYGFEAFTAAMAKAGYKSNLNPSLRGA
jgi:serine---pyruvate transaminase